MAPLACSDIHFNGLNLFEIYFFLHHYNIFSVSCKLWGQLDRKETRAHSRALFWRSYARCQKILLGILLALSLSLTLFLILYLCVIMPLTLPLTLIFVFALRWPWVHIKILDVRCRVTWSVQTPRLRWSFFSLALVLGTARPWRKTGEKICYFQQTDIEELFLHPQYDKADNDIAIIRLKQ